MGNIKRANASGITKPGAAISDVPDTPTIGTATDAGTGSSVSVTFTAAATGGAATSYTVTSNPGGLTGTGASSPITVTGLTTETSYTFTVTATNSTGTSAASSASNSVAPASVIPGAYDALATVTVPSGGLASITFAGIPAGYKDLQIRTIARTNRALALDAFKVQFNEDTGNNYYISHYLFGAGSGSGGSGYEGTGSSITVWRIAGNTANSGVFGAVTVDVLDYTSVNKNKTLRYFGGMDNNGSGEIYLGSGFWINTSIITSITISPNIGTAFNEFTQFALYGVK